MIDHYAATAQSRAELFSGCTHEQALVYAVEDVVAEVFPWATMNKAALLKFVDHLSEREGIDSPSIDYLSKRGNVLASACFESRTITVRGSDVSVGTALHEIAHLTCASQLHGSVFRNELVRVVRRYGDVEHAALLHQVFGASGLTVAPWESSS